MRQQFSETEKFFLIILIMITLILLALSIYSSNETILKTKAILNNKIHIIKSGGVIEQNFVINYNKNKNKLGLYDIIEYDSNASPKLWNTIVKDITNKYHRYDAFIVLTDKDTLPYTASAISFMLENLGKPVIVTNDNLISSINLASSTLIPEVIVHSNKKILRGCRSVQNNSSKQFISPNYPELNSKNSLIQPKGEINSKLLNPDTKVIIEKITPGMDENSISYLLQNTKIGAVILELEGCGTNNLPNKIINIIYSLVKKGVIVVAVSNCNDKLLLHPNLIKAGVISAHDMTLPAVYTKISLLLEHVTDKKLISQLLHQSLRGEI